MENSILNYDLTTLKNIVNKKNVNEIIFKIFDDDKKPNWTPLIKVATLKKKREENLRYNGVVSSFNSNDDYKLAKLLINSGADLNYQDKNGNTALIYCVYYNNIKLLKLLIKSGADLNIKDNNGSSALIIAGYSNKFNIGDILIKSGADQTIKNNNGDNYSIFLKLLKI
jgi:ankyrin repeat protein